MNNGDDGRVFGFACLKCQAITLCSPKIIVPGEETYTWLTLGQRELVFCPICRDNKQAEFLEVTRMNAMRVVDAAGRAVAVPGLTVSAAVVSVGAHAFVPPPAAASYDMAVPSPLIAAPAPPQPVAAVMLNDRDFERHIAALGDEQLKALRHDLQVKLATVESALAERRRCIVCCERDRSVVLMPCKHMLMCSECSEKVKECPACRIVIQDRIRPFA